jgi:hypothetical protein
MQNYSLIFFEAFKNACKKERENEKKCNDELNKK